MNHYEVDILQHLPRKLYLAIYSGLTKTSTALPRLSSKRTIL
ncbi:hypothetical protein [Neisseria meningitidis]|nr:hypothetical protein [Neisseria meningitidis]